MSARIRRHLAAADAVMGALAEAAGPLRLRGEAVASPFRHLARAIAHQQLNGTAAESILRRFVALYHDAEREPGTLFPEPSQVIATTDAALRSVGFSFAKIAALKDLAAKALDGVVPDTAALHALDDEAIVERITQVRGIGRWTVEMMLMFQLGRPDVLPVDDFGVRNGFRLAYGLRALPTPRALAVFGTRWAPYRSAAAWYLWRAVELAKAGTLPPAPQPRPRVAVVGAKRGKSRKVLKPRTTAKPDRAAASAAPLPRSDARTRRPRRPAPRSRAPASKK